MIQGVDRFSPLLNCVNPARVRISDLQTTQTRASALSGQRRLLYRRNSMTGGVEVLPLDGHGVSLNEALHS